MQSYFEHNDASRGFKSSNVFIKSIKECGVSLRSCGMKRQKFFLFSNTTCKTGRCTVWHCLRRKPSVLQLMSAAVLYSVVKYNATEK